MRRTTIENVFGLWQSQRNKLFACHFNWDVVRCLIAVPICAIDGVRFEFTAMCVCVCEAHLKIEISLFVLQINCFRSRIFQMKVTTIRQRLNFAEIERESNNENLCVCRRMCTKFAIRHPKKGQPFDGNASEASEIGSIEGHTKKRGTPSSAPSLYLFSWIYANFRLSSCLLTTNCDSFDTASAVHRS